MAHETLQTASETVDSVAARVDDAETSDRLSGLADQLSGFATGESSPDHGRLARIQSALHELDDELDGEVASDVEDALDSINEFRKTLDGV